MFAAIPFFELRVWNVELPVIGNLPIDPWATLVCLAFIVGMEVARARALRLGLEVRDIVDASVFIVASGFLMGHIVTVVAYHPERLREDGIMAILRVWEGFSSYGGFLGAILGAITFFTWIRPRPFFRYADVIAYGFPFGYFFGRVGCGVVHDHIGRLTTFPLAMEFPKGHYAEGIRHELGLYEAAYLVLLSIVFYIVGQKDRAPGTFMALFAILYTPARFGMEFLRNDDLQFQDARYAGLTPAQWGSFVLFALGVFSLRQARSGTFHPWPMDGGPDQARRALQSATAGDAPAAAVGTSEHAPANEDDEDDDVATDPGDPTQGPPAPADRGEA